MSDVLDDFDFDKNHLPPQTGPEPIEGKPKRNLQRWVILSVILIALPIAIWQGNKEEQVNLEEWRVKEDERVAAQARGNQAKGDSVKEIDILAGQQQRIAEEQQQAAAASAVSADPGVQGGPLPTPPTGAAEELPLPPALNQKGGRGAGTTEPNGGGSDFDNQRATSGIIALLGSAKKTQANATKIANGLGPADVPLSPEMFMSKTPQPDPNAVTANLVNALKGTQKQAPTTRAESAEQWMRSQQQQATEDGDGIYARPAHKDTVIMEGSMLDAALLTSVNTDLPGEVTAIITRDVYDSIEPTRYMLIPKGSTLIGSYNSGVEIGQERIMMAFKRLIFPNGASVNLVGMPGTDAMGRAGMEGDVDNHFLKMFGASFMIAGISKLMTPKQPVNVNVYSNGGGNLTTEAGAILTDISGRILRRNESIPPTITIPAGHRFNVRVSKDIHLPPYKFH